MSIWDLFRKKKKPDERFILCLDGGGMRGIVTVSVLKALEKEFKDQNLLSYFDLIAGTSTGGLISLALSCPSTLAHKENQIDLDALLDTYLTMGKTIFPPSSKNSFLGLRQIAFDKYSTSGIEGLLNKWFGNEKLESAACPTLIMAYDLSTGMPYPMTSYNTGDMLIKDVARATSAAPTYFAPLQIGPNLLVDGGVIANNPVLYAYSEARKLFPDCEKFHFLSIGTASSPHTLKKEETSGIISWIDQVSPMYSTAQKRTSDIIMGSLKDSEYIRIDGTLGTSLKMDDVSFQAMVQLQMCGDKTAQDNKEILSSFAQSVASYKQGRL